MIVFFARILFSVLLLYLSITDIKTLRVPFEGVLCGACGYYMYIFLRWEILGYSDARAVFIYGAAGAVLLYILTFLTALISGMIMKKNMLGGGDIRLFALIGLCLGPVRGIQSIIVTCMIMISVFAVITIYKFAARDKSKIETSHIFKSQFPLVPAISLAAILLMFV